MIRRYPDIVSFSLTIMFVHFMPSRSQPAQQKSLQQREAEYKEARLRILGEDYSGGDNCNNSAAEPEPRY